MSEYLLKQIYEYATFFPGEITGIQPVVEQIKSNVAVFDRKTNPGHITASGIILSKDCILMIRHPALGKWLQPGGHVENGETPVQAAIREVAEETGISAKPHPWHDLNQFPIDIDIHAIPENERKFESAHVHYDFRYILTGSGAIGLGEHSAAWKNIDELKESNLTALVKKILELGIVES
jgi:8-oxo-dGTP pyrophosphatase MutT (NUDIX family)